VLACARGSTPRAVGFDWLTMTLYESYSLGKECSLSELPIRSGLRVDAQSKPVERWELKYISESRPAEARRRAAVIRAPR
jgi:hypothetical protein